MPRGGTSVTHASTPLRAVSVAAGGALLAVGLAQPATAAGPSAPAKITAAAAERAQDGTYALSWTVRRPGPAFVYASTDPRDPSRSGRLVARTTAASTTVGGLDPARRWYFEVAPKRSEHARGVIAGTRHIAFQGTANTRDLGGYTTSDGRAVRWGAIYRSDALASLTDADMATLASLNLRTAVDFRGPEEIAKAGPNRLAPGTRGLDIPLLDEGGNALAAALTAALHSGDSATLEEMLGDGKAVQINVDSYRRMATSKDAQAGFAAVLRRLAGGADTPLLYNCTAGKDRTGLMSAVILTVLGVPRDTVIKDFLLSNDYLAASHQQTYDYLASKGIDTALIRPLMEQRAQYLESFFDGVDAKYGTFHRYVRDGLGLDAKTVAALKRALLTR
jgi:protein-tyrosine phosphatase